MGGVQGAVGHAGQRQGASIAILNGYLSQKGLVPRDIYMDGSRKMDHDCTLA